MKGKKKYGPYGPQVEYRSPVPPPTKAAAGVFCAPHRARMGVAVQADIIINGEPFCKTCYRGQGPIVSTLFLAQKPAATRSQSVKGFPPMRVTTQRVRCASASP
jgi:hypothetical protein